MLLLNEFVMYLIKFVALGLIAFAGIMFGIKYKKNKLAKDAGMTENNADSEAQLNGSIKEILAYK